MFISFASLVILAKQNVLVVGIIPLNFPFNSGHGGLEYTESMSTVKQLQFSSVAITLSLSVVAELSIHGLADWNKLSLNTRQWVAYVSSANVLALH